jgi:hypothetical protein
MDPIFETEDPRFCVTGATLLGVLHEHARGIDAQVRLLECIFAHGVDERLGQRRKLGMPAADRRAG